MHAFKLMGLCLLIALGASAFADETLSTDSIQTRMKRGGKHWQNSKQGVDGFKKYEEPGKLLFIWPQDDRAFPVNVADDGAGTAVIEFRWQLQPGARFSEKHPEYLTYIWGEPDGKAMGFQVTNRIDPTASSGKFTATLSFSKMQLATLKGEHSLVFLLVSGGPQSNFVEVKLSF